MICKWDGRKDEMEQRCGHAGMMIDFIAYSCCFGGWMDIECLVIFIDKGK